MDSEPGLISYQNQQGGIYGKEQEHLSQAVRDYSSDNRRHNVCVWPTLVRVSRRKRNCAGNGRSYLQPDVEGSGN